MWCVDPKFQRIAIDAHSSKPTRTPMCQLKEFLKVMKRPLKKLNKDSFADIHQQGKLCRAELECIQQQIHQGPLNTPFEEKEREVRTKHVKLLGSSISPIKQQSAAHQISYGDQCTRFFITKIKQRKLASYVCSVNGTQGNSVNGFDKLAQVVTNYNHNLHGKQNIERVHTNLDILQ